MFCKRLVMHILWGSQFLLIFVKNKTMLGLGTEHTYYYYLNSVDMRKGFNGLSGIVKEHMDQNQNTNVVYAF
ncbi:IS66 family insertion sequence element accessory protein TnpB, partial [Polaribacter sp. IC063]|uniref:IS66 family insertion sequence element accessory protein TnpB n=2 Tax=Polaribacter sp. IC063 TaxID=57031 RepID=UPI0011BF6D98